jgi:transketolase|tara:strand:- start:3396 stop:4202 length:807 start_codon:yes stop_codon:yes gene_type:complete
MNLKKLENFARNIRKNIIFTAFKAGAKSAHIGGALSAADIIAVLYSSIMKIKKQKILDDNRDRFILSKGHACLALYSALVEKKIIKRKDLETFESDGSNLLGHPIINKLSGIEFSTGSLGMGLSLGVGVALAAKKKQKKYKTYVILGDGECNEGSIWESILCASHFKLDNIVIIVDKNNFQQTGKNSSIMDLKDLTSKFKSFGCSTTEINGHNVKKIYQSLMSKTTNKPKVIVANTIKGKGIKLFENDNNWHHSIITKSIYKNIIKEI